MTKARGPALRVDQLFYLTHRREGLEGGLLDKDKVRATLLLPFGIADREKTSDHADAQRSAGLEKLESAPEG
jgi:hypothetical protein